ncbi:MAG TPA: HD domain-containing protein [Chloroflexi bacterium]|nr:HD domain-containing protein [Chloroflexota bacterium]
MTTAEHSPNTSAILNVLAHAAVLKRLPRTGWLLNGIQPCESVADHTTGVALLTLALASALNADWQAAGLERPIDAGRAVQLAILHDLAESVVTDLPRRSAQLIGAEIKRRAEATALTDILAGLAGGDDYATLWTEYATTASPEARLVHDADRLEMVHQALQYERAGHHTLGEFWCGHHWHYRLCEHLYQVLQKSRP